MFAAEISCIHINMYITSLKYFYCPNTTSTIYLHGHTGWIYMFGIVPASQRHIHIHMFPQFMCVCVCVCVCVCMCGMVIVCGKETWMHLQEHVNTFVQVTFWPWTLNSYDTLIRTMQRFMRNNFYLEQFAGRFISLWLLFGRRRNCLKSGRSQS